MIITQNIYKYDNYFIYVKCPDCMIKHNTNINANVCPLILENNTSNNNNKKNVSNFHIYTNKLNDGFQININKCFYGNDQLVKLQISKKTLAIKN